jgi:hypothetical protein
MATRPVTDEQCREVLAAFARHGSDTAAAHSLGLPRGTFVNRLARARQRLADINVTSDLDPPDHSRGMPFEREWETWMREIGMAKDRYAGPARPRAKVGRLKVVAAGDFHAPFHHKGALARMIQQDGDADICVLGGDFGDAHCASTFTKYEHIGFHEEMAAMTAVMQVLSETYPTVKYLRGSNHPDRFEKRLRESISKDLLDAVLSMTGGVLAPDLAMVKRYPNVEVCDWQTPTGERVSWLMNVGDVLFSHAEKYSRVPGAALRFVHEWLDDFSGHLGLDDFRAVVQFHTHAQAQIPWRSNQLLIEPGCMCLVHHYQLRSKLGGRPQRLGYVVMELVDGKLDVNSVRLRWLDAEEKVA